MELFMVVLDAPVNCGQQLNDKWEVGKRGVLISSTEQGVELEHVPTCSRIFIPMHRVRYWETMEDYKARLAQATKTDAEKKAAAEKAVLANVMKAPRREVFEVPAPGGDETSGAPRPPPVSKKSLMADMTDMTPEEKRSLTARVAGSKPRVK